MSDNKARVQQWLGYLRESTYDGWMWIIYIREELRKGSLSFADIGTSEEELEELRVKGCKIAAQELLGFLRSGTDQYDFFIGLVREEARRGNFSLADIGTSEEELEELRAKGFEIIAQQWNR